MFNSYFTGRGTKCRRFFIRAFKGSICVTLSVSLFAGPLAPIAYAQQGTSGFPTSAVGTSTAEPTITQPTAPITPSSLQSSEQLDFSISGGGAQTLSLGGEAVPFQYSGDLNLARRTIGVNRASGAFTHSYQFSVPPGRNGLAPSLALIYNNQDKDHASHVGFGWSLSIPYIRRNNKSGVGINNLYTSDTYYSSLDGELVKSGAGTYLPKVDSGAYRTYSLTNDTWTVTEKNGTVHQFGVTASARQDDTASSSRIYKWMLEETRDTNDNYIAYSYFKYQGDIYPDEISYTGFQSSDGPFTVSFERATRTDEYVRSDTGFFATTSYRVSEIRMEIEDVWQRKYTLGYGAGANNALSLLTSVVEEGPDNTQKATEFAYTTSDKGFWNAASSIPEPFTTQYGYPLGTVLTDINGDAIPDLLRSMINVYNYPSYIWFNHLYIGEGGAFSLHATATIPTSGAGLGTGYFVTYGWSQTGPDMGATHADVNGDGRSDLIWNYDSWWSATYLASSTVGQWDSINRWLPGAHINGYYEWNNGFQYQDVNGDGLVDKFYAYNSNDGVDFNDGTDWESSTWEVPVEIVYNGGDLGVRYGDFNGDGLTDMLKSLRYTDGSSAPDNGVYLGNGHDGWTKVDWDYPYPIIDTDPSPNQHNNYRFFDVNGDGFTDYAAASGGSNYGFVYLGTGSGWVQDVHWKLPYKFNFDHMGANDIRIADIDGDRLPDLAGGHDGRNTYHYLNKSEIPDQLSTIVEPEGGTTEVEYTPSTQYFDDNGDRRNTIPFVINTVSKITRDAGQGTEESVAYVYDDAHFYYASSTDREFAGFGSVTETDAFGNYTVTSYHQGNETNTSQGEYSDHISKAGRAYLVEEYDADDDLFRRTVSKWERYDRGSGASFVKLARETTLTYDGDGDHKDSAVEYTYDNTTGSITNKTEYGEVSASTDGSFTDTESDKRTTDITYAASSTGYLRVPKQETVKNQAGTTVADTKYTYDNLSFGSVTKGNPTKVERWVSGSTWLDTEKTYNDYGLVTSEKDPRDKTTTFTYDAFNLYPATTTNPEGHVTARQYDYSSGKAATTTDPNGFVFVTVYDGLDRPLVEKQPDLDTPSTLVTKTAYEYTDTKSETKVKRTDYLDASLSVDSYQYFDGLGRLIQTRTEAEDAGTFVVTDRVYNERGKVERESLPYFSQGSASTTATTSTVLFATYTYDPLGRPDAVANAVGTTTYAYDQWETVVTDPNGTAKDLHHDAYGRLVKVEEHNDGSTYTTLYEYSALDNLTKITDAESNVRNFTYDGLGRRTEAEDLHASADSTYGTWLYAYDAAGNVSSTTDPNGQTVNYTYDDVNRMLTEDYLGEGGTEVTYGYDTCTNGIGQLCAATSSDAATAYTYNALGLIENETRTIAGTAYTTSYDYDRQGNVTLLTYPDNAVVRYTYNTAGGLDEVEHKESGGSFASIVDDIDYGPHGKATFKEYANGLETTYTYDADALYRLTNITTEPAVGVLGMMINFVAEKYRAIEHAIIVLADEITAPFEDTATNSNEVIEVIDAEPKEVVVEEPEVVQESEPIAATSTEQRSSEETATTTEIDEPVTEEEGNTTIDPGIEETTSDETATPTGNLDEPAASTTDLAFELQTKELTAGEGTNEGIVPTGAESSTSPAIAEETTEPAIEETALPVAAPRVREPVPLRKPAGIEVADMRTRTSKTYLVADNDDEKVYTTRFFNHEVHYFDRSSKGYKEYSTDVVNAHDGWQIVNPAYRASISKTTEENFLTLQHGRNLLPWSVVNEKGVQGAVATDQGYEFIRYEDAFGDGIDLEVTPGRRSVKKEVVIRNKQSLGDLTGQEYYELPFKISSTDLEVVVDGEAKRGSSVTTKQSVEIVGSLGTRSHILTPYLRGEAGRAQSIDIRYEKKKDGLYVTKLLPVAWLETAVYPVRTDATVSYGPTSGDGAVYAGDTTWDAAHDATAGYQATPSATYQYVASGRWDTYGVQRGFLPFDTSGLPDNATISAASLGLYIEWADDPDNDGDDFITIVQTDQPSVTTLTTSDFNNAGATDNPTEGIDTGERKDITNITLDQYTEWDLNSTGIGWISKTGYTKLGLREGHDVLDHAYAGPNYALNEIELITSEYAGTTKDPYLDITYTVPAASDVLQDISYSYDAVGNITSILDASETNAAGTTTYAYDDLYRLVGATTTQAASGDNYTRNLTYSSIGNVTSKSDVGTYLYQGSSGASYANPHAVTSVASTAWTYDKNGNLTDDGTWEHTYDYRNRLVSSADGNGGSSYTVYHDSLASGWEDDWNWNANVDWDNATDVHEGTYAIEVEYTQIWGGIDFHSTNGISTGPYDNLEFAISSGSGTVDAEDLYLFTYDTNKDDIDYVQLDAYTPGGALASNTWYEVSIPFSALGSDDTTIGGFYIQTADATATIYVDEVEFVKAGTGTTTTYGYDHAGSRVFKGDGTATTTYANKYYDTDGSVTTKHIYAGGEVVATVEDDGETVTVNTIHTDHLGGTNVVSDSDGNLEQLLSYYPFGATRIDEKESTFDERKKFTGHEYDEATSLYYMQSRYQNPEVGRFISQDPAFLSVGTPRLKELTKQNLKKYLSDPQGFNSYSYTRNNPLRLVDENGEWFSEFFVGEQSFSDFSLEIGQATDQLTQESAAWNFAIDHPVATGLGTGVVVGGGSVGLGIRALTLYGYYDSMRDASELVDIVSNPDQYSEQETRFGVAKVTFDAAGRVADLATPKYTRQFYEIFRSYLDSALEVAESVESETADSARNDVSQNDKNED